MEYNDAYLIGASLDAITSVANGVAAAELDKDTMKFNRIEAEKARAFQYAMWNEANQYNHPIQAMQRLTEAGLNPNLVYGSGIGSLTAASVPSSSQASYSNKARFQLPQIGQMLIQSFLQNKQVEKNMELIDQEVKTERSKERVYNAEAFGKEIDNFNKQDIIDLEKKYKDTLIEYTAQLKNLTMAQQNMIEDQANSVRENLRIAIEKWDTDKYMAYEYLDLAIKAQEKQFEVMDAEVKKLYADAFDAYADAYMKNEMARGHKLSNDFQEAINVYKNYMARNIASKSYWEKETEMYKTTGVTDAARWTQDRLDNRMELEYKLKHEQQFRQFIYDFYGSMLKMGASKGMGGKQF